MHVPFRALLRAALAAGVVAVLSGCVPADDPVAQPLPEETVTATATATATVTATPTPSATPVPADAASLLLGPTSFSLVDDSGAELGTWAYRDGTGAVAALTEAFGSEPTESDEVPYEGYRTHDYTWPGFVLSDTEVYDAGGPELKFPEPDVTVKATAPAVADVAISTLGGVAVGDSAAEVAAERPESVIGDRPGAFLFDNTPVGSADGTELTNGVGAIADDEVTVSSLNAPYMNWGV